MKPITLPSHWSPEQALAVYEFIHQLCEQLWCQYRQDLERSLGPEATFFIQPPTAPPQQRRFAY